MFIKKEGVKLKKVLKKTKIVGTIGPASENMLKELFEAGLNVTRINYSHGSWDEQSEKTEEIIRLRKELDLPIALLLDMKGPEIRTGMLYTGKNTKIQCSYHSHPVNRQLPQRNDHHAQKAEWRQ